MNINQALLESAHGLRDDACKDDDPVTANLRKAFADYAEACARRNDDEVDVMAGAALTVSVAIIGLASGFANGDPNPRAVRATLETINEFTKEMMVDFVDYMRRKESEGVRH